MFYIVVIFVGKREDYLLSFFVCFFLKQSIK